MSKINQIHATKWMKTGDSQFLLMLVFILIISCSFSQISAQQLTPLSGEMNRRMEYKIIQSNPSLFTIIKPFLQADSISSQTGYDKKILRKSSSLIKRKLFYESLVEVDSSDYYLYFDPVFDFSLGQDNKGLKTFTNTRGFVAGGRLGNNFAFGTSFYENQAILPTWIHNSIQNKIITGQGMGRLNGKTWDYAHVSGYLSFSPLKKLNLQMGQGKNFIGDGYRSLLLSDVAYNYPYSRISFISRKVMYSWMLGIIQDLRIPKGNDQYTYGKRMISSHVLSTNLGSAIQFSVIKNTVYDNPDTTGKFRPHFEEFSPVMLPLNSKNSHSIWGANLKVSVTRYWWIYGQAIFDNLIGKSNLHTGFQVGSKYFNAFGLKGLYLQAEYNQVNPQTYTSANKSLNWLHYRESLAHPYGNNISESLVNLVYTWRRWQFDNFTRITQQLKKTGTISGSLFPYLNNGREVFHNYTQLNWYLNPKTTSHFSIGLIVNKEKINGAVINSHLLCFSFRTVLFNNYLNY